MTDNNNEQAAKPQILLTFDSADSINFTPQFNSCLPTQILHAGKMLLMMGERKIADVWNQRAMEEARKAAELDALRRTIGKG